MAKTRDEYERVAEAHAKAQAEKNRVTIAAARANAAKLDWDAYTPTKPSFIGVRGFDELRRRGAHPLHRLDALLLDLGVQGALSGAP